MAEQMERGELLELSRLAPHVAIAECLAGLSCKVFAGGEEVGLSAAFQMSQQLPGCERQDDLVVSNKTGYEYWLLARTGARSFQPLKGPLTAGELRSAFWRVDASASGVDDSEGNNLN